MKLSIVIVNWNTKELTLDCLASVKQTQQPWPEVIVVDNGSTDGSLAAIRRKFPTVKLVELPENRGFGIGNNAGIRVATGELTLLLNSDTVLTGDLTPLLSEFDEPGIGAVGPRLLNRDRSTQTSLRRSFPSARSTLRENPYAERLFGRARPDPQDARARAAWIAGAAMILRTDLLKELGGFDESFFMYYEETDLCRRIADAGYRIIYNPAVSLIHLHGGSSEAKDRESLGPAEFYRSQLHYLQKHRVPGRSLVRLSLLAGSATLWGLMTLRRRPKLAERYKLIVKSCLTG